MAYNYYDNFSGRSSTNRQAYQQANNNFFHHNQHHHGGISQTNERHYNHQIDQDSSVVRRNKKNMLIRNERPTNMAHGNVYYPGHDQPLMAMMVVDSSPSSPSSNSQEGGRGYSGIPGKQQRNLQSKKVTDRNSKAGSASGDEKLLNRSSKKRVNGITKNNNTATTTPALRSAADEEYLTTKKVEVKRTKNTERRVQRQVVLEDGRVLNVGGPPHVVVDTIEDIQTHETNHVEDQNIIDELKAVMEKSYGEIDKRNSQGNNDDISKQNNVVVGHPLPKDEIISDTFKRTVNTHDVQENVVKTHMAQDLGLISRRGVERLIRGDVDPDRLIQEAQHVDNMSAMDVYKNQRPRSSSKPGYRNRGEDQQRYTREKYNSDLIVPYNMSRMPVAKKKVYEANSHRKVVDTEDVHNISRRNKEGKITSETVRTEKHEVYDDKEAPDDGTSYDELDSEHRSGNFLEHDEEKYRYTKTDKYTDYFKVSNGNSNQTGKNDYPQRSLKLVRHGPHITTEDRELTVPRRHGGSRERMLEEEHIKHRKAAMRKKLKQQGEFHPELIIHGGGEGDSERTDVLTQKPLNFHHEEKTRRKETDKWLDRHFGGSEWSLSHRSSNPANANELAHNRSRFYRHHQSNDPNNVDPPSGDDFNAKVRRAQSFNCIPVSYNNPISRVIKHTTTTYRPGMEGKVVYSSITKNVASPQDAKMRAYHSASNLNSRNTHSALDNHHFNGNYDTHFQSSANQEPTMKSHSTSLLNGIVKEHSPILGKKDTSVVREIPITKLNQSHGDLLNNSLGINQPNRPPRKGKGGDSQKNNFMKSTGDLYAMNDGNDRNYYENRRSYYFGTSADNLTTNQDINTSNIPMVDHSRGTFDHRYHFVEDGKRKSRKDQLISESTPLKSYERVQSAPNPERQYPEAPYPFSAVPGGESITTGFESTAGLLGLSGQVNEAKTVESRQIPIQEEVYHDSPRPERKPKRLIPTMEGRNGSSKEKERIVYRSESTRKAANREPLYRKELPRNKLYPSPHKGDRRPLVEKEDNSQYRRPSFVKAFLDDELNQKGRSKYEHNYYHHQSSSSSTKKNKYMYDQEMVETKNENGGGYQFSKSFHDLSFANNMHEPKIYHSTMVEGRNGTSVDNNLDLILPPKDYLGYRAHERSDGYRTLGARGTERKRSDESKSSSNHKQKSDTLYHHKKRSQSFMVNSGNISSDDKYGYSANIEVPSKFESHHMRSRQKLNDGRRSRKLYGDDAGHQYADDFHKNKRHTYHFPDVDTQFNHCEDLTFTKHLSRENISNGNLNKSSTENLLDESRNNGTNYMDSQYYSSGYQDNSKTKSTRSSRAKDYRNSSYQEEIRNAHHRSSSSPPSKTDGQHRNNNVLRNNMNNDGWSKYHNDDQVHYSTISHSKTANMKYSDTIYGQNNNTNHNLFNDNYIKNNNLDQTDEENLNHNKDVKNECSFLHIEREIPMQSASLEAQKFKTIIFLSGQ